jgi:hypothetical protein
MDILQEINKTAFGCMGKNFHTGLSGPHAFDRQGLIFYTFNSVGIPLPRVTVNVLYYDDDYLMDAIGPPQTGDIFFFGEKGYAYTAGIFLGQDGNNRILCLFDLGKEEDSFITRDITVSAISIEALDNLRTDFLKFRRHKFVSAIVDFKNGYPDLDNPPGEITPPLLFATECANNVLLQWRFENNSGKLLSYRLFHNGKDIYHSVSGGDFYILRDLEFDFAHDFFLQASHPLHGMFESGRIALFFEKRALLEKFKNDFIIPRISRLKTNKFDFNVFAEFWNKEYPPVRTNLIIISRRILDEPIYPFNFFRLDLIGERQQGTEFYYDIQTEITTGDDLAFNVVTPMFYYNQNENGSLYSPLALTAETVNELSRRNVLKTLQSNDENYLDQIRPTFKINYEFSNNVPFRGIISLHKKGEHEFMLNQMSDTEIIMDMTIPNTDRLTIGQFMERMYLYCPNGDLSRLLKFSVIVDGMERVVEGGLI